MNRNTISGAILKRLTFRQMTAKFNTQNIAKIIGGDPIKLFLARLKCVHLFSLVKISHILFMLKHCQHKAMKSPHSSRTCLNASGHWHPMHPEGDSLTSKNAWVSQEWPTQHRVRTTQHDAGGVLQWMRYWCALIIVVVAHYCHSIYRGIAWLCSDDLSVVTQ